MSKSLRSACAAVVSQGRCMLCCLQTTHVAGPAWSAPEHSALAICDDVQDGAVSGVNLSADDQDISCRHGLYFFRVLDSSKAFSRLTLLGDTSAMLNVDFLVQTYHATYVEWPDASTAPVSAIVTPADAILSAKWLCNSAVHGDLAATILVWNAVRKPTSSVCYLQLRLEALFAF